jgi:hypothetical protein
VTCTARTFRLRQGTLLFGYKASDRGHLERRRCATMLPLFELRGQSDSPHGFLAYSIVCAKLKVGWNTCWAGCWRNRRRRLRQVAGGWPVRLRWQNRTAFQETKIAAPSRYSSIPRGTHNQKLDVSAHHCCRLGVAPRAAIRSTFPRGYELRSNRRQNPPTHSPWSRLRNSPRKRRLITHDLNQQVTLFR